MKLNLSLILIPLMVATSGMLVSGCGNPLGSTTEIDKGHHPGIPDPPRTPPVVGSEFVPASQRLAVTSGARFKVLAGVSTGPQSLSSTTTPRGYKFYSNVQGSIVSFGEQQ